jgi:hypothetical protein
MIKIQPICLFPNIHNAGVLRCHPLAQANIVLYHGDKVCSELLTAHTIDIKVD